VRAGAINVIAFFIGYFLLLSFHLFPVGEMPATALDRLTAFQPGALLLFLSLYYVPLGRRADFTLPRNRFHGESGMISTCASSAQISS
jgi:hypothetical protein